MAVPKYWQLDVKKEEDKNRTVRIDYLVIVIVFRVWIIIAFHQLKTGRLQDT